MQIIHFIENSHQKIGILGCGWLGLPLAQTCLQHGFEVQGSSTRNDKLETLTQLGIQAFLIHSLPEIPLIPEFFKVDVLVLNLPPKVSLKGPDFFKRQIEEISKQILPQTRVIFTSATSVYPDLNREVFETDATEIANPTLWEAERFLEQNFENLVILRLAGLMGPDRYPAKYFSGKKGLTIGQSPVNYIHQTDAVNIVFQTILNQNIKGTYNVVCPKHPDRKSVFDKNCEDMGLEKPEFIDHGETHPYKIVNGSKIIEILNYTFVYEDPLTFKY